MAGKTEEYRTDWLPTIRDDDVEEKPTGGTESGQQGDLDFPIPGGGPRVIFNGVNGLTGEYWTPPLSEAELVALLRPDLPSEEELEIIRRIRETLAAQKKRRGLRPGVDAKDLTEAGWGVIFPQKCDPAIRRALSPLVELRREQTQGSYSHYFKEYVGRQGYRPGESAQYFLSRHGSGAGLVDPARMPYYLLLVGSPEEIPFHFQSQLGVRHAVGRIHFDSVEGYRHYAESVKRAEGMLPGRPHDVVFFSAANEGDGATQRIHRELIEPLAEAFRSGRQGADVRIIAGREASRDRLRQLLRGESTPSVLFTGSHGLVYPVGSDLQRRYQGALLCGEWPGPDSGDEEDTLEYSFSADDVAGDASLLGSILFHFACYGAGTPHRCNFTFGPPEGKEDPHGRQEVQAETLGFGAEIAPEAFISALPARLLSLPEGAPLAIVGHVDRAWTTSFSYLGEGRETVVFEGVLWELLDGSPLGHAMRHLTDHYSNLAADITVLEDPAAPPARVDTLTRFRMWTACNDARNYVILGDPAVRLPAVARRRRGLL